MFRKTLITGIIALSTLSTCGAFAQENAIRFVGSVSSQTCNISVNDSTSTSPMILMSAAKASDLSTAGDTSTPTTFKLKLTGCTDPGTNGQSIKIHFASNNVDASGNLANIAPSAKAAQNVAIQLLDADSHVIDLSSGEATAKGFTLASGANSGDAQYTAQYIATGGAATAGDVEATVQYAISYL